MCQDASQMKNYQAYYILKINHFWKRWQYSQKQRLSENMTFKSEIKITSIKEVFNATQKGSKNYKKILQRNTVREKNQEQL